MKNKVKMISALLLACTLVPASAEKTDPSFGVAFDFNRDGITDGKDWDELYDFVLAYRMNDDEGVYFGNQEVPATINLLIDEAYGNRASFTYDTDVSSVKEFYLPSIGLSTPVKNQSPLGACWSFGTISSIESNLLLHRSNADPLEDSRANKLDFSGVSDAIDLSELYLVYKNYDTVETGSQTGEGCVPLNDDDTARYNLGGFPTSSSQLLTAWVGPLTEAEEPYEPLYADEDGAVFYGLRNPEADETAVPAAHIQSFYFFDSPSVYHTDLGQKAYVYDRFDASALNRLKQAIVKYGALTVSYQADISMPGETGNSEFINFQNWCQYDSSEHIAMNHMVSVVGWNDNLPKENFANGSGKLPEGDGAFLLKNSWGNYDLYYSLYGDQLDDLLEYYKGSPDETAIKATFSYGIPDENDHGTGYLWISYYDHSLLSFAALDADDAQDGFDYEHIYQYDESRPISFYPVSLPSYDSSLSVANVFTAERDEALSAVSAYAPANDVTADISVYRLKEDAQLPDDGDLVYQDTVVLSERGFHTIPVSASIVLSEGDRFAVVERLTSAHDDRSVTWVNLETGIQPEIQTADNINEQIQTVIVNEGESFLLHDSTWYDVTALNEEADAAEVFRFGNAAIKAYTNPPGTEFILTPPEVMENENPYTWVLYVSAAVLAGMILWLWFKNRKGSAA